MELRKNYWAITHDMTHTPEYRAWQNMRVRCYSPKAINYDRYGGRGIKVCDDWNSSFMAFYRDVGPRPSRSHSIERIDNDGNYEPGNVVWALREQQENNKRTSRLLAFGGIILTAAQWSKKLKIPRRTLYSRLESGWTIQAALTTPVSPRRWLVSPGNRIHSDIKEKIKIARREGRSCADIASEFGISPSIVWKLTRHDTVM